MVNGMLESDRSMKNLNWELLMRLLSVTCLVLFVGSLISPLLLADKGKTVSLHFSDIMQLNGNSAALTGKIVKVKGYIRAGFSGWHVHCFVSKSEKLGAVEDRLWLDSVQCLDLAETGKYRKGLGVVIGKFIGGSDSFVVAGQLFPAELKGAEITWCPAHACPRD